jgi:hypothetical protein
MVKKELRDSSLFDIFLCSYPLLEYVDCNDDDASAGRPRNFEVRRNHVIDIILVFLFLLQCPMSRLEVLLMLTLQVKLTYYFYYL